MAQDLSGTIDDANDLPGGPTDEFGVADFVEPQPPINSSVGAEGQQEGDAGQGVDDQTPEAGTPPEQAQAQAQSNPPSRQQTGYEPIIQLFEQDPSLLDEFINVVKAKRQPPQQAQPEIKPPTPPVKPATYSPEDAYSNPQSESFKYRVAMDEYRDEAARYNVAIAENVRLQQEQERQLAIAREQERQRDLATRKVLKEQYGLTDLQIQDFMATMSKPDSWDLGNIVDLYKIRKGLGNQITRTQVRQQELTLRNQRANTALPPAGGGGKPAESGEIDFGADLIKYQKGRFRS